MERGFASGTLGPTVQTNEAREAGGRRTVRLNIDASTIVRAPCRQLRGLPALFTIGPRVPLAKPRSTLGFMLTPASRASNAGRVLAAMHKDHLEP